MTFAAQMSNDMAVFLNPDEFGETVLYLPASDRAREIVAVVNRTARQLDEQSRHQLDAETVDLFCRLDAAEGMAAPGPGDRIRLAEDSPGADWSFDRQTHRDGVAIVTRWIRRGMHRAGRIKPEQL